jgi:hypothetical protein
MATYRAWRLRRRPEGALKDSDLELVTEAKAAPGDGQLLVKNLFASIDPTHRIWMSDRPQARCVPRRATCAPSRARAGAGRMRVGVWLAPAAAATQQRRTLPAAACGVPYRQRRATHCAARRGGGGSPVI